MLNQTPVQIAWVTHDLDVTEAALSATLGARTWVRMSDVHFAPEACTYRGAPADFTAHVSFSYAGDTQLEVIQPVTGSDFLAESGAGLHHVCVAAADTEAFDAMVADAERDGVDVIGRGSMPAACSSPTSRPPTPASPASSWHTSHPTSRSSSTT